MIEINWPPKVLSPNGRTRNKSYFNRIFQSYKRDVFYAVKASGVQPNKHIRITFHPKSSLQDKDNAIAMFKAGQDGLALAWGMNDRDLEPEWVMGSVDRNGRITIEIREASK